MNHKTNDRLMNIGRFVAESLGPLYSCEDRYDICCVIRKADTPQWGIVLVLRNEENRISVHGDNPRDNDGSLYEPKNIHSITIGADKELSKIATDIKRRFLDEYNEQFKECIERVNISNEYSIKRDAMAARFAEMTGGKVAPSNNLVNIPYRSKGGYVSELYVRVHDNTIDIKINNMPADIAEQIIKLLNF